MRHILCFGNPLHGDDGFGPKVYERLARLPAPRNLRLFDAGTPGLAALALFEGCEAVVIVDALAPGNRPGQLVQLAPEDLVAEPVLPGHGLGLGYLLRALAALPGPVPKIDILAAEALSVTPFQPGLSQPMARAVETAAARLSLYFTPDDHG